ncbi:MAG: hypothetical protein SFY92_08585 [Verrucomicrobiae bacterium]|nr:hypothetical protein [Verrucomicrobiae bacterium]
MFEFKNEEKGAGGELSCRIKVYGIGTTGLHCVDRLVLGGHSQVPVVGLHTCAQKLEGSIAPLKILLGEPVLRGAGAGGDPEMGTEAAEHSADTLRVTLKGAQMIFLTGALGGGTGSGTMPVLARVARQEGIKTLALVTMPFAFEGRRRNAQAEEALKNLRENCDVVLVMDHGRFSSFLGHMGGLREAFESMNSLQMSLLLDLWRMYSYTNVSPVALENLRTSFGGDNQVLCGFALSEGEAPGFEAALEQVFQSPLMANSILLRQATEVLVNFSSGSQLTMQQVHKTLDMIKVRTGPKSRIVTSAVIRDEFHHKMGITVIASVPAGEPHIHPLQVLSSQDEKQALLFDGVEASPAVTAKGPLPIPVEQELAAHAVEAIAELAAEKRAEKPEEGKPVKPRKKFTRQEILDFQDVKGRFEKLDPTIVNGENLDIPAFMRKRIAVKR